MPDRRITNAHVGAYHDLTELAKLAHTADEERDDLHKVVKRTLAILTDTVIDDRQKVDQASALVVKTLATWDARRADGI